jgi:hypothetical protein
VRQIGAYEAICRDADPSVAEMLMVIDASSQLPMFTIIRRRIDSEKRRDAIVERVKTARGLLFQNPKLEWNNRSAQRFIDESSRE